MDSASGLLIGANIDGMTLADPHRCLQVKNI